MKVTTELKRLIGAAFDKKRQEYHDKQEREVRQIYKDKISKVEDSSAFKNYVRACNELYEYLKEDVNVEIGYPYRDKEVKVPYYYHEDNMEHLQSPNARKFIQECYHAFETRGVETPDFQKEKDSLLVKLTYEKDLEQIKELLKEYGIEI